MTEELKCLNCGEGFIPTCHITRQKYCSNECRHRYNNAKRYHKGEVNICPECGDVVEQRERGAGRWRRFCSDRCRIKYDQRKIKERRMAKGRSKQICPNCEKEFQPEWGMSCAVISKAVGLCEKTVRTHLRTLADAGFIKMEHHGRTFSYSLCPIQSKVQEHRSTTHWISRKQAWITDEVFDAVFPLHYQKGVRSGQCWPSYATIGTAVGMSRETIHRHVRSLIEKGLIQAEDTMIRRRDGRSYNGSLLYTVKPIEQILKEREEEFLVELKLAEAQHKWDRRCQKRDRPRSAL